MAGDLFTTSQLPENPDNLIEAIKLALIELQRAFPTQQVEALYWNDAYVAIPLKVHVDLPSRGVVHSVDIREQEPVFLLLHRYNYPFRAPSAYSNRHDFPAEQLPHLNPTRSGSAANFCLHRGNINNWFAEHTILGFVKRVEAWLRDAAADRLIRKEDGFEDTRIPETLGYCIYQPAEIRRWVYQFWRQNNRKAGYCFLWYKLLKNSQKEPLIGIDSYAIWLENSIRANLQQYRELSMRINRVVNDLPTNQNTLESMLFGILAWSSRGDIYERYFADLPATLGELQEWAIKLGIPLSEALESYLSNDLQLFGGIPITIVIPRPQKLISSKSFIEILNFVVSANGEYKPDNGGWNYSAKVFSMGHRTPLSLRRAREISSQPPEFEIGRILLLGCGAVGSKLALHLARSGQGAMTLVDFDDLSPHNLVRHSLFYESLGRNKAEALQQAIKGIYYADDKVSVESYKISVVDLLLDKTKDVLHNHSWLIDATASSMVLNLLCQTDFPQTLSCCRCEIADEGRFSLFSVEGLGRNPRLDDIQAFLFDLAINNLEISQWLKNNQKQREEIVGSVLEDIYIGISCSSETMRLADELISLHTASFATGLRRYAKQTSVNKTGVLQIGHFNEDGQIAAVVQYIDVLPVTRLTARNDPAWEVRLRHGFETEMKVCLKRSRPNETGGLLIGMINLKRKIIYVTRVLPAPLDSKSSPYIFVRGIQDIPKQVLEIQDNTGGMLGYVGEWHTHPIGGGSLSSMDMETVNKIQRTLAGIQLPTHVLIVTPRGLYPHVFDPIQR